MRTQVDKTTIVYIKCINTFQVVPNIPQKFKKEKENINISTMASSSTPSSLFRYPTPLFLSQNDKVITSMITKLKLFKGLYILLHLAQALMIRSNLLGDV